MTSRSYLQQFDGGFSGVLRWDQLDELWGALRSQREEWYVYDIEDEPPAAPLTAEALDRFIARTDAWLRREHEHDYCGIVYADCLANPSMVKIYDPRNLGAACGSSGRRILPKWVLSRMPPAPLAAHGPQSAIRESRFGRLLRFLGV